MQCGSSFAPACSQTGTPIDSTKRLPLLVRIRVAAFLVLTCVPTRKVAGQAFATWPRVELGATAGLVTADGRDFSGTKNSMGAAGIVRLVFFGHLGLGVGLHYSDHTLETLPERIRLRSWYGEVRYTQTLSHIPVSAFVGVRIGSAHEDISIVHWTADGGVAGGLAGVRWRVIYPVALEVQVSETAIHLGDRRAADGSVMTGTTSHGTSFGLEGGLVVAF